LLQTSLSPWNQRSTSTLPAESCFGSGANTAVIGSAGFPPIGSISRSILRNSVWPGEVVDGGSSAIRSGVSLALRLMAPPRELAIKGRVGAFDTPGPDRGASRIGMPRSILYATSRSGRPQATPFFLDRSVAGEGKGGGERGPRLREESSFRPRRAGSRRRRSVWCSPRGEPFNLPLNGTPRTHRPPSFATCRRLRRR